MAIDGIAHIASNHGKLDTNIHRTTQIGGYCEGIPKGNVRVGFNVGDCVGKKSGSDAYTGWNSVTHIMVEEVPPPQPWRARGNPRRRTFGFKLLFALWLLIIIIHKNKTIV